MGDDAALQPWRREGGGRWAAWFALAIVPVAVLIAVKSRPALDYEWLNLAAHFWIVLVAAAIAVMLGNSVYTTARRRRDPRLLLVSLGFIAAAGFLGLHALATPGVLVAANPGFEIATPLGLLLGGIFVALSAREFSPSASDRIVRSGPMLLGLIAALMIVWAIFSLGRIPPLDEPLIGEPLDRLQTIVGAIGVILYAAGAWGYLRLYRQRGARLVFRLTFAFALLAEAMVVIAFALNWKVSWWEWHVLMLGAFMMIALAARQEWHEERFSTLYSDDTLFGAKEISVLFSDLKGFTSFSESHELAEIVRMLNTYFGRIVPLMADLGGEVHQIVGDAIMVTFNQFGDQPDHAALAARAALALQREGSEIAREHPDWPRFRAGVNTGQVISGVVGGERGHRKHAVVGDTVNLAARFEGSAPVGEVVIGEATKAGLPEGSTVEQLPPLELKGKSQPIPAYLLRSVPS
jgi:class 3 adenylate cyclase